MIDPRQAIERTFKEEGGRVLATLIRQMGDFQLAEDALQDALAAALAAWPAQGVPASPGAWLTTAARRKAIDRLRREQTRRAAALETLVEVERAADTAGEEEGPVSAVTDDRLRLMFTCCHPALALETRVALTLRTLGGLSTPEVARAFLVPEATLAQRLVRAKRKIREARIPYRVPPDHLLLERLEGVLAVVYLVFNEGYVGTASDTLTRPALSGEAIRLGRMLAELMPDEPEALGLLALMLLQSSREKARVRPDGSLVVLEEQDRSLWDRERIREGQELVERVLRMQRAGPYQVQAAIAAVHAQAARTEDTDWREIVALYDTLLRLRPSPVVALNRAVAVAMAHSPRAGLTLVNEIIEEGELGGYYLLHAARADLLRRLGEYAEAATAYGRALELTTNPAEQAFLRGRLAEVGGGGNA